MPEGYEGRPVEATRDIVSSERSVSAEDEALYDLSDVDLSFSPAIEEPALKAPPEAEEVQQTAELAFADAEVDEDEALYDLSGVDLFGTDAVAQDPYTAPSMSAPGVGMFRLPMPGYEDPFAEAAPMEHPEIPGLEFLGSEVARLPPELSEEVPEAFTESKGRLTDSELHARWYQTAAVYNKTRDSQDRMRVLGDFIHDWNPEAAEKLGYRPGGHITPEGFWAVLDGIDKYIDRPLRTLVNTMWDLRKGFAAADLSPDIENPGLDEAWRMMKRNWDDDKATIPDLERGMRSLLLFSQNALTGFDDEAALLSEGGYEQAEDAFAETLTEFGWDTAAPLIKLFTGASDADIERSIQEAIEEGSQGGHFAIGLTSAMLISPLNFVGGSGLIKKGLGEAATSLLGGGIKLTPRGAAATVEQTARAAGYGRRILVEELAEEFGEEAISGLARIARKLDRADEVIDAADGPLPTSLQAVPRTADEVAAIRDDLLGQFDNEIQRIKGGEVLDKNGKAIPASALREDATFRAAAAVTANTTEAVNVAFKAKKPPPIRGAFAVEELARLQVLAKADDISMDVVNKAWVRGLEQADEAGEVLVKVMPERVGNEIVNTTYSTKSPEVAYLYERALAGEYGVGARIAALRPEYDALETLLSKGVKGVPKLAELKVKAAEELRNIQKSGMRWAPTRTAIKKGAERVVERVRGGKEGLRKLKDPKRALLNGESIATNVNPVMFSIAHAMARQIPWLDKARRAAAGVGRLTRHPAIYTRKNVAGKLELIPRAELDHPAILYSAQKLDRQRAITRNILQARYPQARAALLRITDDEEMLELMNHAVEMGWGDPANAIDNLDEIITVAAIRKLKAVNDEILDSVVELKEGGTVVRILSPEDTEMALNALERLAATDALEGVMFPGYDVNLIEDLSREIAEHGAESARLLELRAQKPALVKSADEVKDRTLKLAMLKKRLQIFGAFYERNLNAALSTQAELRISDIVQARAPEIKAIQEQLISVENKLRAKKTDELTTGQYSDLIDSVLKEAEIGLPDFSPDEVIQLAVRTKARWIAKAKKAGTVALRSHMATINAELEKLYGDEAHIIMDLLYSQAEMAVKQGVVDTPEQWFYGKKFKVGGVAPEAAPGMLFHTTEAAPVFFSKLEAFIERELGATRPQDYNAARLNVRLLEEGVPQEVLDKLDIDGWLFGQDRELGRRALTVDEVEALNMEGGLFRGDVGAHDPSRYKQTLDQWSSRVPRDKRTRAWGAPDAKKGMSPDKFRVPRRQVEDYINSHGIDPGEILDRLDSYEDVFKLDGLVSRLGRGKDIKAAELNATHFPQFIEMLIKTGETEITRGELLSFLKVNGVKLQDDWRGYYSDVTFSRGVENTPLNRRVPDVDDAEYVLRSFRETVADHLSTREGTQIRDTDHGFDAHYDELLGEIEYEYRLPTGGEEYGKILVEDLGLTDEALASVDGAYRAIEDTAASDNAIAESAKLRYGREQYQGPEVLETPGGEKYTEALVSNPLGENGDRFLDHYSVDVVHPDLVPRGNEVAVRFNIRTDTKGRRTLFIEELQGDNAAELAAARRGVKDAQKAVDDIDKITGHPMTWEHEQVWFDMADSDHYEAWLSEMGSAIGATKSPGARQAIVNIVRKAEGRIPLKLEDAEQDWMRLSSGKIDYGHLFRQGMSQAERASAFDNHLASRILDIVSDQKFAQKTVDRLAGKIAYESGYIDLGLKRMLKFAVDEADETIDAIAWTTGKTQDLRYRGTGDSTKGLIAHYDELMPAAAKKLFKDKGAKSDSFLFQLSDTPGRRTLAPNERSLYDLAPGDQLRGHGFEITDELRKRVKDEAFELFQEQEKIKRGMMQVIEDDKVLIQAFETANKSTIVHELGHLFRRNLADQDQVVVKDWLVSEGKRLRALSQEDLPKDILHLFPEGKVGQVVTKDGEFTAFGEELFARGFENYLATGKAPKGASAALKQAFVKLKEWITDAYNNILGRNDVQVNDEVKAILDRYFLVKEKRFRKRELWEIEKSEIISGSVASVDEWEAAVKAQIEAGNGKKIPLEVLMSFPVEFLERVKGSISDAIPDAKKSLTKLRAAERSLTKLEAKLTKAGDDQLEAAAIQLQIDHTQAKIMSASKAAERAAEKAGFSKKQFAAMQRKIGRPKKVAKEKEFAIPKGSRERRTLEAVQELYKNQMATVVKELQEEAFLVRQSADDNKKVLLSSIAPAEKLSDAQKEKLQYLAEMLGKDAPEINIPNLPRGRINQLIKEAGDPKLAARYERAMAKAAKLPPKERAAAEALADAKLYEKLENIRVKAEDSVALTPLEEAIAAYATPEGTGVGRSRQVGKGLPGAPLTKEELAKALDNFDSEMDELIEGLEELNFDLRHPKEIRESLETSITSSVNNLAAAAFDWKGRLEGFADAEAARLLQDMTEAQKARVYKMINNPELHYLTKGREAAKVSVASRLAEVSGKIESLEAAEKPVPDSLLKTKAKLERQAEIIGDGSDFDKIVDGARIIKKFYDEFLEELKTKGILDESFNEELFFRRTEVGNYVPHVLSWVARRKLDALVGQGLLPSSVRADFTKFRKIKGTIAEINIARRTELAGEVVRHQALKGTFGPEAEKAANESISSLSRVFDEASEVNPASPSWDVAVENARLEAGLDDMYEFFETNPLVLMERYSRIASKKVADAVFIQDILDLFPRGRQFAKMYPTAGEAASAAAREGFVRLGTVDHLQSVMMSKLPQDLRRFEDFIKQRLSDGAPTKEILDHLEANGVKVDGDIVNAFATTDVYVPVSVAEYLNWMNGAEAKWAKDNLSLTIWDGIHSWMKGQATVIAFAHVGRNWIGNVVSASQELGWAAVSPINQFQAARIWGSWGDDALDSVVKLGQHEYTVKEWRQIFLEKGFFDTPLSSDFLQETMGLPSLDEMSSGKRVLTDIGTTIAGAGAGALAGAMFGLAPAGAFAGVAGSLLLGRRWKGTKAVRGGNALERVVGKTMREIDENPKQAITAGGARLSGTAAGGLVGTVFAGPVGGAIGAYLFGASMPDYLRMMGGINQSVEAQARLSMAVAALKKGRSIDDALVSVNKALRDYSDLTPIEKNVLRRMFFFYTWEAGNFKFQLNWMKDHPIAAKQMASFFNGLYKFQFDEEEIASVPEGWRYRVLLRTGAGKIMGMSGLPMEPMMDILTRGKRAKNPRGVASRIHPIPLTLMEWMIGGGHSVYYNKGWEELTNVRGMKNGPPGLKDLIGYPEEGEETWVPVYKDGVRVGTRADYRAENATLFYLMQRFPGWRIINQYMILAADTFNSYAMDTAGGPEEMAELRAKWWERALMFTFGWKVSNIDFDQQKSLMAWRMQQELMHELKLRKPRAIRNIRKLNVATGWTEPRPSPQQISQAPIDPSLVGPFVE